MNWTDWSQSRRRGCNCCNLQNQPFSGGRFGCASIFSNLALKRRRYYVSSVRKSCVCCKVNSNILQQVETFLGWNSRVMEDRSRRSYTDGKSKRSSVWALSLCFHKNKSFQTPQGCEFANQSWLVPVLTYGLQSLAMAERVLSQAQAEEMNFFRRVHGVTFHDKMCNCGIGKTHCMSSHFCVERRSHLSWFGPVSRMLRERLTRQVLLATSTGTPARGRSRNRWSDCIFDLTCPITVWSQKDYQRFVNPVGISCPLIAADSATLIRGRVGMKMNNF